MENAQGCRPQIKFLPQQCSFELTEMRELRIRNWKEKKTGRLTPPPSCKPIRYCFTCSIKHKQEKSNWAWISTVIWLQRLSNFFATNFLIHSCQMFFCWKDWEEWCFLKHCHGENKPLISRVQQSEGLQNFLYIKIYQDGN